MGAHAGLCRALRPALTGDRQNGYSVAVSHGYSMLSYPWFDVRISWASTSGR